MSEKSLKSRHFSPQEGGTKFGTFRGVFIPSILTILGVIMYLRMGWVVGQVGVWGSITIVTLSSAITFLTALSMSATATNMKVKGGGAYYMISRSFGVETGAAVGLPLFLAQALGVSFYIAGFAEAFSAVLPLVPIKMIAIVSLGALTVIAYFSADLALKAQLAIFVIIVLSLGSLFLGSPLVLDPAPPPEMPSGASFWIVFAVFFPAVTGIEAGMAMSGDLKKPSIALPVGTLSAVLVGFFIYLIIPIFLTRMAPADLLVSDSLLMEKIAIFGPLITLGVWVATLSSALGALLGAPRTLQALAKDGIVPSFFGRNHGPSKSPRIATFVTCLFALAGVLLGNLDAIAPILSMFFLTSYGFLNLAAGIETLIGNPSWRPKFRTPAVLSLLGSAGCFATMFMIDSGATFSAAAACLAVFYFTRVRNLNARWADIRRGILSYLARYSIYALATLKENSKSWRPNIVVFSGSPTARWYLIEFADAICHGKGFLTIATIVPPYGGQSKRASALRDSIVEHLKKQGVPALPRVVESESVYRGMETLIKGYGLGSFVPNTFIFGDTEKVERFLDFSKLLLLIARREQNIVIVREPSTAAKRKNKARQIDVWWGGEKNNAGLTLALAYMLQTSPEWKGSQLNLKTVVDTEEQRQATQPSLEKFAQEARLDMEIHLYPKNANEDVLNGAIRRYSQNADLVFLGMRPPEVDETTQSYSEYYQTLLQKTEGFPLLAFVLANEGIHFQEIFA